MRAMLVAVLVLAGCGGEGGGDDGAGGMGGAPGAGSAPAAAQGLTAQEIIATIQDCEDVPGEPPCCPDPVELLNLGGADGMTIQCPEGFELEDSTPPSMRRDQTCVGRTDEGQVRGAFLSIQVDSGTQADDPTPVYDFVEMGHRFAGYQNWQCWNDTGRTRVVGVTNANGRGGCISQAYIDLPPNTPRCD